MTSSPTNLPAAQKRLLILLQKSLWGKIAAVDLFEAVSHDEWEEIMDLAAIQGIFGLVYDGINGLPEALRPPRDLYLQWSLGVKRIEYRHHLQLEALQSLAALYTENGIKCLLIKGPGLSFLYPVAEHRESGDLDIYLFGDYDKGNRLMEEKGIKIDYQGDVHSKFEFDQIPVENHVTFLQIDGHQSNRRIETILHQKLSQQAPQFSEQYGVYIPSLSFNLLHLHVHAVKHFLSSGIVLRHLCDWAILLHQLRDRDDYADFYETAHRFDLQRYVDAFNFMAVEYLGLPEHGHLAVKKDSLFINRILADMMAQKRNKAFPAHRTLIKTVKDKIRGAGFLFQNRWKYTAISNELFIQELIFHMRYCFKISRDSKMDRIRNSAKN